MYHLQKNTQLASDVFVYALARFRTSNRYTLFQIISTLNYFVLHFLLKAKKPVSPHRFQKNDSFYFFIKYLRPTLSTSVGAIACILLVTPIYQGKFTSRTGFPTVLTTESTTVSTVNKCLPSDVR